MVSQEDQVLLVHWGPGDLQDLLEGTALPVDRDQRDHRVMMEDQERWDSRELLDHLAYLDP